MESKITEESESISSEDGPEPFLSLTKKNKNIRVSFQDCLLKNNETKLQSLLEASRNKQGQRANSIHGLLFVLEQLMVKNEHGIMTGYLPFQDAYEMYCGFFDRSPKPQTFRDHLLHPDFGLCVVIVDFFPGHRFIALKSDDIDIPHLMEEILELSEAHQENVQRLMLEYDVVKDLLSSMDTEYDRNVAKTFLASMLSRSELYHIGIKPDRIVKQVPKVIESSKEAINAMDAAEDMMTIRLKERLTRIEKQLEETEKNINNNSLSEKTKAELNDSLQILQVRKQETQDLLNRSNKSSLRKFEQSRKRLANQLLDENRVKRRKLGAGRPELIGEEEEEFIAKCIADKSTAHGRRHDTTMYLNNRVKQRHFLSLANYYLLKKGKKLIRSATTVYNRSRPKNIRSRAANQHKGKWLFCYKKPPKAEDDSVETTHHQRAHVKNAKTELAKQNPGNSLVCSMDDKAYLRPGTDVGFCGMRKGGLYDVTDQTKQKALPQHDFNIPEVNVTPSSFRFLKYSMETVEDKEKIIAEFDQSIVTLRPKHYIGSSGTVWANDYVCLRHTNPEVFEYQADRINHPKELRCFCAILYDCTFYYKDTSMSDDVECITSQTSCKFRSYEVERLNHMMVYLERAIHKWNENLKLNVSPDDKAIASEIIDLVNSTMETADVFKEHLGGRSDGKALWPFCVGVLHKISKLHGFIEALHLPPTCKDILDLTDAGPGVGVSNLHVRFRDAEIARLHNSDRRNRIHRARNDSGQNEAERTNAAIGEAIADGSTIKWEHFKVQDESISNLTIAEIENVERVCMEKNAWKVCEEVCSRIDGEPGPHGDMKAYVTEKKENQFFWNTKYLDKFIKASELKKAQCPGQAYFRKIECFIDAHYSVGELFFEFTRGSCKDSLGEICEFCVSSHERVVQPVRRPYPDKTKEGYHYCTVENTPSQGRGIDDYQPRAQIKKLFQKGKLSSEEDILNFSKDYIVEKSLVEKYVRHLEYLEVKRKKREENRKKKKEEDAVKGVKDYDWEKLYSEGQLKMLKVKVLDMYIKENKVSVPKKMKKKGKLELITAHIARAISTPGVQVEAEQGVEETGDDDEEDDQYDSDEDEEDQYDSDEDEDADDEDLVIGEIGESETDSDGNGSESDGSNMSEDEDVAASIFCTTRSGRRATTWRRKNFE